MISRLLFILLFLITTSLSIAQVYDETDIVDFNTPVENSEFGTSMCLWGDFLVVGVPKENKAYVYEKSNEIWSMTATLTPTNVEDGKFFGYDVSIYDDIIVVGAPGSNTTTYVDSKVYLFAKPTSGWSDMTETCTLSRKLTADEEFWSKLDFDFFGGSVDIYKNTIVVGAYRYNSDDYRGCGGVFVFEKPESGWLNMTETGRLIASDENNNLSLGKSVAIYDDVIVAGEGRMNSNSAAYVFEKPENGWTDIHENAKLTSSDNSATFGSDISMDSSTIVIAAFSANKVYVFEKSETGWESGIETSILTSNNPMSGDYFGKSVSLFGNFIVIGAPEAYDYTHSVSSGLAYFFEKSATGWHNMSQNADLFASNAKQFDNFGYMVVNDEDEIFVSAIKTDKDGVSNSGSVYRFDYEFEPQDILLSNNSIEECSPVNEYIGDLTGIDGNRYDFHTFFLVKNGENNYDNDAFLISGNTLLNNTNLDYEKKDVHTVCIEVKDTLGLSFVKTFDVQVENTRPTIVDSTMYVPEDSPIGTRIGQLHCTVDTNSVWFSIEYDSYKELFSIDSLSGEIFVNNSIAFNSSYNEFFDVKVRVSDGVMSTLANVRIEYGELSSVSIASIMESTFDLYPNPAQDHITIKLQNNRFNANLSIFKLDGSMILQKVIKNGEIINISQLTSGVYIVKVNQTGELLYIK